MNNKYLGKTCVVCNKVFEEGDDIVVCPDCGSPHHRACYQALGHCQNESFHQSGKTWEPQQWGEAHEQVIDGDAPLRCPRCATLCKPGTLVCPVCGSLLVNSTNQQKKRITIFDESDQMPFPWGGLLNEDEEKEKQDSPEDPMPNYDHRYATDRQHTDQDNSSQSVPPILLNPFTTPYGGVAPDEVLDGIPARDMVVYVGPNSHYFLPRFKRFTAKMRSFQWHWPAFFLHFAYYFYRKMYLAGAVILLGYLLVELPLFLMLPDYIHYVYEQLTGGSILTAVPQNVQRYLSYGTVSNFMLLLINFISAALANRVYFWKAKKDIGVLRQQYTPLEAEGKDSENPDSPEYLKALAQKGRVNLPVTLAVLAVMAFINFALPAIMVFYLV